MDRRSLPAVVIIIGGPCNMVDFLTHDAMLSAVYAIVVCLSLCVCVCVCHIPVLYQNG